MKLLLVVIDGATPLVLAPAVRTGRLPVLQGLADAGTMHRGVATLTIAVVPDSGTGDLTGLRGTMATVISGGAHSYTLEYSFDEPSA